MLRISTLLLIIAPKGTEKSGNNFVSIKDFGLGTLFESIYFFMEDPPFHKPKESPHVLILPFQRI